MKIIVYHDTQQEAKRTRRPRPGETVTYAAIKDHDEKINDKFDDVVILCKTKPKKAVAPKE